MMNADFTLVMDTRPIKGGTEPIERVLYKGECIAICGPKTETPEEYVEKYGYMAEYRRRWNNGDHVNWSEDLRVSVD